MLMAVKPLPPLDKLDPQRAWQTWEPDDKQPWDLKWAGHLYRRAGFGASLTELREAKKRGFKATLDLLCNGDPKAAELTSFLHDEGAKIAKRNTALDLRGWWLYCMLHSGHPLREKMVLFWHNHFATSIVKVERAALMFEQNKLLRQHALGKFGPFLLGMSKDPAMLIWLDSNRNVKGKANENYAREVMELFSLGVGNYTEADIREAARAFTGWHTDDDAFEFNAHYHDDGKKTILGQTGNWNGDDVVRILLQQKACAEFLTGKLFRFLISESQEPPRALLAPLTESLRKSDYDLGACVRTMLSSRLFFSEHAYRQRIKSPVEFVLGTARATVEGSLPQLVLIARLEAMGQSLFAPPNVKGWRGGRAWLNTSTMLARQNFAQAVAMGTLWKDVPRRFRTRDEELLQLELEAVIEAQSADQAKAQKPTKKPPPPPEEPAPAKEFDPARLIRAEKVDKPEAVVDLLLDAYLPGGVGETARAKLITFIEEGKPTGGALDRRVRELVHALLTMPEYQLA
jgi:uncharacterized protein (DUF1800 family)